MPIDIPPEARDAIPGVAGAVISALFLKGPWRLIGGMVCGGATLAYYGGPVLAEWFASPNAKSLLGFLIGMFGMAVAAKIHEAIQAFAAGDIGKALLDKFRQLLGVAP